MDTQIENVRPSGLKQPSRLPAFSHGPNRMLTESSQSDINVRNGHGSALAAPSIIPSKHKMIGLPEPSTKRKTLAERAGEPLYAPKSATAAKPSFAPQSISRLHNTYSNGYRPFSSSSVSSNHVRPSSSSNGTHPGVNKRYAEPTQTEEEEDSEANGKRKAWDTNGRLEDMEQMYKQLRSNLDLVTSSRSTLEDSLNLYKNRVEELSQLNRDLTTANRNLTADLERARSDLHMTTTDLRQARRDAERDSNETERRHERDMNELKNRHEAEVQRHDRENDRQRDGFVKTLEEAKQKWQRQKDDETADMTTAHWEEMEKIRESHQTELTSLRDQLKDLQRSGESRATESATEVQELRTALATLREQLGTANLTISNLNTRISTEEAKNALLDQEKVKLIAKAHFLEGNQEAQSHEFTTMSQHLQDALASRDSTMEILRKEETLRRKLNNTILELRGNIRVFVRTRPLLSGEDDPARIDYPDAGQLDGGKEMIVHAPVTLTATGKERNEKHSYNFDRAFAPGTPNEEVFEDCRDLIQSVIDGYNVSILSYGQTGSGKTYGMSGPNGIIPSAIRMLLAEMRRLQSKGWAYSVGASFVEVYNETLNDLLGDAKTWDEVDEASTKSKKKERHEIHHDALTGKTTVTDLSTVSLWPPHPSREALDEDGPVEEQGEDPEAHTERRVNDLLETAAKNRRVAATKANERSSRSHSIFILTLRGACEATGETSEGVLNLVDLAGSERLKQSGAEGSRMKETQAINKSLSSLGDVIASLGGKNGNSDAHVPYRNSKLTYLLQSSLGGTSAAGKSSRTLMLLHLSPLQQHWQESRSSLLFGSKVHGTHIGTARKR